MSYLKNILLTPARLVQVRADVFCEGAGLWAWVEHADPEGVDIYGDWTRGFQRFTWSEIDITDEERDRIIEQSAKATK